MPDISVKPISNDELPTVKDWILKNHYIQRWPTGVRYKMGVYLDGKIVGTLLYGPPLRAQSGTEMFKDDSGQPIMRNNQVLELLRAFTTDEAKKQVPNLGSIVVSRGNDFIQKHGTTKDGAPIKAILSYADPEAGHSGKVYKATNAAYLGPQKPSKVLVVKNPTTGKEFELHPMSLKRYGHSVADAIKNHPQLQGMEISWKPVAGKHKYLYPLGSDQRDRDELMSHLAVPLFSYPEPGQPSHQIPNEYKQRAQQRAQQPKQQPKPAGSKVQIIKNLLRTKIKNPETGNDIMVATALKYDKSTRAHQIGQNIVNAWAKKYGIRLKPTS